MEIIAETRRRVPLTGIRLGQVLLPLGASAIPNGFVLTPMEGADIRVERDGWQWRFSVDTELHGPGLHHIFYELLKDLAPELKVTYKITDPTGYSRDLDTGRIMNFYREELKGIAADLASLPSRSRLHVHWALPDLELIEGAGIAGPISRWSREQFLKRADGDIDSLMEDFYIAPHIGKDGALLRNEALYLLQNEITYLRNGEEEAAARVCDALEGAAKLHPTLPLPLEEYIRCAGLAGRTPLELANPRLNWGLIGYRRESLRHHMNGFSWVHPGHFDFGPAKEAPWQFLGDREFVCHWTTLPYEADRDAYAHYDEVEGAELFRGAPAPELAPDENALGLKCARRIGDRQLIVLVSWEAPYTRDDVTRLLNSIEAEDDSAERLL